LSPNGLFYEDFFDDVVKMKNDKKYKDELEAKKAWWKAQHVWSSISEEYNESVNDEVYGE
jgi:hypothetical protein